MLHTYVHHCASFTCLDKHVIACRRWRQEQEERLAKKDASEQEAIEELRRQARQELEDLYKHMDEQLDQTRVANKYVLIIIDDCGHCATVWCSSKIHTIVYDMYMYIHGNVYILCYVVS